ncbi:hypothetical protein NEFER03_1490 [Nematocida sp. LUAm3]|nr:hypothetical protein NEFER03_1490 [Nematocida sp. LUAm3]KAI5174523.1 hypothetical protein NEFER02_0644 [Nematocida sp. LUAm2]KAI5178071.1 hypothetical protein NEFER01_1253 [Nematocida sp. LUAm1]
MNIWLRKENTKNYKTAYTSIWKSLVAFGMLFNVGKSMGLCLGKPESIDSHGIANVLGHHFNILYKTFYDRVCPINVYSLCSKIECIEGKYHINLTGYDIERKALEEVALENRRLKEVFAMIKDIRCTNLYVTSQLSWELVRMLIERIIVENALHIQNIDGRSKYTNSVRNLHKIEFCMKNIPSKLTSAFFAPMALYISYCPAAVVNAILNWAENRRLKEIVIGNVSDITNLSLKNINIEKDMKITIKDLPNTKNIVWPNHTNKNYAFIKLSGIPKLANINITNICTFQSSMVLVDNLFLDRVILKALVALGKENENIFAKKVLRVATIHLNYMPYTFQEMSDTASSAIWLIAQNAIIYIEHCAYCRIPKDYTSNALNIFNVLKNVGILYEMGAAYKSLVDQQELEDKYNSSRKFLEEIGIEAQIIGQKCFECPKNSMLKHRKSHRMLPPLKICLKDSEKLQKAIEKFHEKYDMLSAHAKYTIIDICGFDASKASFKLLVDMFACMRPKVKANALLF